MPDVIAILNAPPPWEGHGTTRPLPAAFHALLSRWPGGAHDFFHTSAPAIDAPAQAGIRAPGLVSGDMVAPKTLTVASLAELQAALADLPGRSRRHHLHITGAIRWDACLLVTGQTALTLDFSEARITVAQTDAPLIRVTDCRKLTLSGLRIAGRNAGVLHVTQSQDVALCNSALSDAAQAAVTLAGGCQRVLIDTSAFGRNNGPALRMFGEVSQVIVARSHFDGPSPSARIEVLATTAPEQAASPPQHPSDIRILDCHFGPGDVPAILAQGSLGLWVERCDFAAAAGGAVQVQGPALGFMLADNRMSGAAKSSTALVDLADTGLLCVFRNTFEPLAQVPVQVTGAFGGLLVAANTALAPAGPKLAMAAIRLDGQGAAGFLSSTLMLNTIRGPFGAGIAIDGEVPRLFLFDNHILGVTGPSLSSQRPQPMVTSANNFSPQPGLNLPLTQAGDGRDTTAAATATSGAKARRGGLIMVIRKLTKF